MPHRGRSRPRVAQNALFRAVELVPQDDRLRHKLAADFERRGLIEPAIAAILPSVHRAHSPEEEPDEKKRREKLEQKWQMAGEAKRETAHEMLARLRKKLADGAAGHAAGNQSCSRSGRWTDRARRPPIAIRSKAGRLKP